MSQSYFIFDGSSHVDVTAWLALLVSLCTLCWLIWSEFTSHKRRRADEYWYRHILAPHCIEPLVSLLDGYLAEISKLNPDAMSLDESKEFCDKFAMRKEDLLAKLWMSKLFSENYYGVACDELDGIEDFMSQLLGAWYINGNNSRAADIVRLRDEAISRVARVLRESTKVKIKM